MLQQVSIQLGPAHKKASHTLAPEGMHLRELADDMLSLLQSSLKSCGAEEGFPVNGKNAVTNFE